MILVLGPGKRSRICKAVDPDKVTLVPTLITMRSLFCSYEVRRASPTPDLFRSSTGQVWWSQNFESQRQVKQAKQLYDLRIQLEKRKAGNRRT